MAPAVRFAVWHRMPTTVPWKNKNPKPRGARTKLTAASRAKAKAAAARAGRRYPNLIDNMNAAKAQNQKGK